MQIDFYYWEDCPSHDEALARLRDVLAEQGVDAAIRLVRVASEEEAADLGFLGSPSIRIDGVDIDPTAPGRAEYGLTCRAYTRPDGRISPLPPREMIVAALRQAAP